MEKLGSFLRQERERKGIALVEVEQRLRVPLYYLAMLEGQEDQRLLADPLYLIPFLRMYATFLDLDPAAVISYFVVELQNQQQREGQLNSSRALPQLFKQPPPRSRVLSRILTLLVTLGIFAVVGAYTALRSPKQPSTATLRTLSPFFANRSAEPEPQTFSSPPAQPLSATSQSDTTPNQPEPTEPIATGTPEVETLEVRPAPQSGDAVTDTPHLLRVQAREPTWIRVTIDGHLAKDLLLQPGQTVEWSAQTGFTVTLGNAGGVALTLNGHDLPALGKSGQVIRNIRLPSQG
jgi:cytoskeleton protein RodZ